MFKKLYTNRLRIFFFSQIAILFGSLIVPSNIFETVVSPTLFFINITAGVILLSKRNKLKWIAIFLLLASMVIVTYEIVQSVESSRLGVAKMVTYFLFYVIVTYELIGQVWRSKYVESRTIFGLISGYISLGLIGFFICLSIEIMKPGSFEGFLPNTHMAENLMYFSYITLLTIGYGDILPVTPIAQKAVVLIGLIGQVYLVVITAIVVGKYVNQVPTDNNLSE